MKKAAYTLLFGLILSFAKAQILVSDTPLNASFVIVDKNSATPVFYDPSDFEVVKISVDLLRNDIGLVAGKKPEIVLSENKFGNDIIIVGTVGKNKVINELISSRKLNVDNIEGQWERFIVKSVKNPFPGVSNALVIAGSDKRGTAYGVFSLSEAIGISPWYWWADIPVKKQNLLYLHTEEYVSKSPSVKYRGIFLNDEDWGLHPWASKNMDPHIGDIGPTTYKRIFELLLRLKANMVAPAMHECTKAFFTVAGNMKMADAYGILITTSHCEPLLYNNASEWDKEKQGEWNYVTNKDEIIRVLEDRVKQACQNDNIYTIALRGMHDEGMKGGSDEEKLKTLDSAIKDQRAILSEYIDKPLTEVPQIFVPYKEVLGLYEKGLKVPKDITLVWPDDNYGYIKKLSNTDEQQRRGGAGVYYHLSYLGWPNDYLWLNTTPPALMFAEMHKAWSLGANKYWLVNVGDIKPGEMGTQLFLEMAWDFDKFSFENINQYQVKQLASFFGEEYEKDLAYILDRYYYHGFTRKPEFMTWDWRWNSLFSHEKVKDTEFSFVNYNEAENRLNDYKLIANIAEKILNELPEIKKAAFFELVYYPVKGASLYNHEMLIAQKNRWYAKQGRSGTIVLAEDVKLYHDSIASITNEYNELLNGKWKGMMTAPGFLPEVQLPPTTKIKIPAISEMAVFAEGQTEDTLQILKLPEFNNYSNDAHFFEIYNKGSVPFKWKARASEKWIKLDVGKGETKIQNRVHITIDWNKIPAGASSKGEIIVSDGKKSKTIQVSAIRHQANLKDMFIENSGAINITPSAFHRKTEKGDIQFQVIDGLGYSNSSLQLGNAKHDSEEGSFVEYDFYTSKTGEVIVYTYMLPLFAKDKEHSTSYGIQIDDLEYKTQSNDVKEYSREWAGNVIRNSAINKTKFVIEKPGKHTLKLYSIDSGMIVQKIIIDLGGLKESYLGPLSSSVD